MKTVFLNNSFCHIIDINAHCYKTKQLDKIWKTWTGVICITLLRLWSLFVFIFGIILIKNAELKQESQAHRCRVIKILPLIIKFTPFPNVCNFGKDIFDYIDKNLKGFQNCCTSAFSTKPECEKNAKLSIWNSSHLKKVLVIEFSKV
jgi:hypothetical protein